MGVGILFQSGNIEARAGVQFVSMSMLMVAGSPECRVFNKLKDMYVSCVNGF